MQINKILLPIISIVFLLPALVFGHCDTINGPVIQVAKKALEEGNVDLVLIWVQKKDEDKIRNAFWEALAKRRDPQNKGEADMRFFETLVRIHRQGEGVPYTGIKFTDNEVDPAILAADKAIENGSAEGLIRDTSLEMASGARRLFDEVVEKNKHRNESVASGREYVEAYTQFIHYVEGLHEATIVRTSLQEDLKKLKDREQNK